MLLKKPYQLHVRVLVTKLRGPRDHPVSFYTRRRGIKQCYYEMPKPWRVDRNATEFLHAYSRMQST